MTRNLAEKETLGSLKFLQIIFSLVTVVAFVFAVVFYLQSRDTCISSDSEQIITMARLCFATSLMSSFALLLLPSVKSIVKASLIYIDKNERGK